MSQTFKADQVPFILVRMDWMAVVQTWLDWCRNQMKPDKITAVDGVEADKISEWIDRAIHELDELLRVSQVNVLSSPLVFMRRMEDSAAEHVPMPPRDPNEKGN